MKTVLMLTDSLGLPRVKPERVADDECWVYRLQDTFSHVLKFRAICTPGMDTRQLLVASRDYHQAIKPDLVILQVGIVDCYPRALKRDEVSIIKRLPKTLSMILHKQIKRHYSYLIKRRRIQYIGVAEFKSNLQALRDMFPSAQFRIVPIAPPCSDYKARNPLIESAIASYNEILIELFGTEVLSDCYAEGGDRLFMSDNHHLNTVGHTLVYNSVSQALYELLGGKA
jgi:lysophospholipase L1-like esterase